MRRFFERFISRLRSRSTPLLDARAILAGEVGEDASRWLDRSRPYTRWWWLAGPFVEADIRWQLEWLRSAGFGGVELAWLWPSWMGDQAEPGVEWLGQEWSDLIAFTKREADRLGLGCDFTFGSCWPFGGSAVQPGDEARTFEGRSRQRLHGSWEGPEGVGLPVLNHLDRAALRRYAAAMMPAFAGGLAGSTSALFCDSLEIDTRRLWDPRLFDRFAERFGDRLEGLEDQIDDDPRLLYDYRTVVAESIVVEFYAEFTAICREHGAMSRVQCHGAPADLLSAYASVDIPESEAILFPVAFSRIAASAAALARKPIVSAETFTCLYGFTSPRTPGPYQYWRKENVADLKLLADALFAQGINLVVWHGMPFNGPDGKNEFFATIHVGPDAAFAAELPPFNGYLSRVSGLLRLGRTESRLAVYLPNEDHRRLGRIPEDERTPGAVFRWEMRHVVVPRAAEGYAPLWISAPFLAKAEVIDRRLIVGDCGFSALLIDVDYLDGEALAEVIRLANAGLPVVLPKVPSSPGRSRRRDYRPMLDTLRALPNVVGRLDDLGLTPLVSGNDLPPFWARRTEDALYLFFAHPKAREIAYPMGYGQSFVRNRCVRRVVIDLDGTTHDLPLEFAPYESILLRVTKDEGARRVDLAYRPPAPRTSP